jgi:Fe-S cluster assembly ATP-binding protein
MTILDITGLRFSVQSKIILDGFTLTLNEGEIHALLGANGTGKTTVAKIIMGCAGYEPGAGEIRFLGQTLKDRPIDERARMGITLAWQEPARFEGLSVRDYLTLGQVRGRVMSDPVEYLSRVGLDPDQYLARAVDKTLSGGERKRIELAAVLAMQPKLALLDEPASGIDMLSLQEIVDVIQSLKQQGTTVLLITHRQEVARIADRASYLCGGRIIATGEPDEIAELFRTRGCVECDGETCHA